MKESWKIIEAMGDETNIKVIRWEAQFSEQEESSSFFGVTTLRDPIPGTSSEKEIIQATHKAIGEMKLERIRAEQRKKIDNRKVESSQKKRHFGNVQKAQVDAHKYKVLKEGTTIDGYRVEGTPEYSQFMLQFYLSSNNIFMDADGVIHFVSDKESLFTQWSEWVFKIISCAEKIKNSETIPLDFEDDGYWQ